MDFIFGSFAEWLGVLEARPAAQHCSLTPEDWSAELDKAGFSETLLLTSSTSTVSHIAFISQVSPYSNVSSPVSSPSSTKPHTPPQMYMEPRIDAVSSTLSSSVEGIDENKVAYLDPLSLKIEAAPIESPSALTLVTTPADCTPVVQYFSSGGEVELVRLLSTLDSNTRHVIWLHSDTEPVNCGLLGIVRTIRHEFSFWRVMLVQFHPSWDVPSQQTFIRERLIPLKWIEPEVLVDEEGSIYVPRVVPAPAPAQIESCGGKPVYFDDSRIWRAYPPLLGPEDVEVKAVYIAVSPVFPGCSEFSGEISCVGSRVSGNDLLGRRQVFAACRCVYLRV